MKKIRAILVLAALMCVFGASVALAAVPDAPVPVLESKTATVITVSWPTVATATSYEVKNGTTLVGTTSNLMYSVTGLTPNTEYTINVFAVNADGPSLTPGVVTTTTVAGGTTASDSIPATVDLGVNIADLFSGVSLIGTTFWPVVAVMAALGMGFWFLRKTRGIIGGRK